MRNCLRDSDFFIISHILNLWSLKKSVWWIFKNQNSEMYIFYIFHADHRGIWFFFNIQNRLVVNWPRKWAVLHFNKNSKISQNVLQKSTTFQNDFLILGHVKKFVGPSPSFSTPNFLSGASRKAFNFMIAFDQKLFFWSFADKSDPQVPVKI